MPVATDRALSALAYLLRDGDDEHNDLLVGFTRAALSAMAALSRIAHGDADGDATPAERRTGMPWRALTDPRYADPENVPYAAQWTGGTMPPRIPGEDLTAYLDRARLEVQAPRGIRRGSGPGLVTVAQPYLTGTRTTRLVERYDGDVYVIALIVRPAEAPDVPALVAALNDPAVVPAGCQVVVISSNSPVIDEGHKPINAVGPAATINTATLADVNY